VAALQATHTAALQAAAAARREQAGAYLPYISPTSPLHLTCISPISCPHLAHISREQAEARQAAEQRAGRLEAELAELVRERVQAEAYLPYISPASRPYLAHISPISRACRPVRRRCGAS